MAAGVTPGSPVGAVLRQAAGHSPGHQVRQVSQVHVMMRPVLYGTVPHLLCILIIYAAYRRKQRDSKTKKMMDG